MSMINFVLNNTCYGAGRSLEGTGAAIQWVGKKIVAAGEAIETKGTKMVIGVSMNEALEAKQVDLSIAAEAAYGFAVERLSNRRNRELYDKEKENLIKHFMSKYPKQTKQEPQPKQEKSQQQQLQTA